MSSPSLVIRNGTVVDGTGGDADRGRRRRGRRQDRRDRRDVSSRGAEEIDARGMLVTPGFVDLHTHYDGAGDLERAASRRRRGTASRPSLFGNCGVGFAPCQPSTA